MVLGSRGRFGDTAGGREGEFVARMGSEGKRLLVGKEILRSLL